MRLAIALLLAIVSAACAAQTPRDFAYALDLDVPSPAPFYTVTLPRAVYESVARGDLGDLRVFNGAGEVVPHAWRPRDSTVEEPAFSPPLFAIRGGAQADADRPAVKVEARSDGTIVSVAPAPKSAAGASELQGYVADLSAYKSALRAVEIERPPGAAPFVGKISLEASDDLASWRLLAHESPVLSLTSGVGNLKRLRIEFAPQQLKYLRLSWPARMPAIEIATIKVEPGRAHAEPQREWKALAAAAEKENEFVLNPGGRFPADRLRLRLPQPNTVAQVDVLYRPASAADSWRPLTRVMAYRLQAGDGEVVSPDIEVEAAPWEALLLRIDPQGGGIGQGMPVLEIGWVPQELVFAARGAGPFRLAYGSARVAPAAYPIESLIPGYRSEPDSTAGKLQMLPARVGEPIAIAGPAALHKPIDAKRWALWGALVAGVLLLGAMAWRLLRQVDRPASADSKRD